MIDSIRFRDLVGQDLTLLYPGPETALLVAATGLLIVARTTQTRILLGFALAAVHVRWRRRLVHETEHRQAMRLISRASAILDGADLQVS